MDDRPNYQRRLWKPALRWGSCSFVLFASVLLYPKPGLSLTENHASSLSSPTTIVAQSSSSQKADHLFQEALRLYDKGTEESLRQAIELWQQVLPLYQSDQNSVAITLTQIGWSYYRIRDLETARIYLERAFPLYQGKGSRENKAETLNRLGLVCEEQNKLDKAIEYYRQEAILWQEVRSQDKLVRVFIYISKNYYSLGDSKLGSYYLAQVEKLLPQVKNLDIKANILLNLGYVLIEDNRLEEALFYLNQAYSHFLNQKNWLEANATLTIITEANRNLGKLNTKRVIDYYLNEVLPLAKRAGDQAGIAIIYQNLGAYYAIEGDLNQAMHFLSESKDIWKKLGGHLDKIAQIYNRIALIYEKQKKLVESLGAIDQAITLIEDLRSKIDSRDLRASYFSTVQVYYENKVGILMEMSQQSSGFQAIHCKMLAFDVTEQSRSRTFLELLTHSRSELNLEKIEPTLRNEANQLQLELKNTEKKLNAATSSEEIAKFEQQYVDFSRRLDSLTNGSQYVASEPSTIINDIAPASLTDAECNLGKESNSNGKINHIYLGGLPDNATLLQYYLGESVSYLFILSRYQSRGLLLSVKELPGRKEIEAAAEKFYEGLKGSDFPEEIAQAGECLRQKILPGDFFVTYKKERLVISADGVLNNIPFAALPLPNEEISSPKTVNPDACKESSSSKKFQNYVPLVTQHEIVNVPSISSIYAIHQRPSKPALKTLAVLADPIFDKDDPRLTRQGSRSQCLYTLAGNRSRTAHSNLGQDLSPDVRAALRSVGSFLPELPCTRTEADAILAEVGKPGQTLSAFDADATYQWIMQPSLSQYRILHFATHGVANDSQPELSGLILSRFNRQRQPIEDYFLRLNKIFNLKLSAELVVLSACETGLGQNLRGEGIIGLTRGFMSAGAKRVIASLWQVDDSSTAELMAKFYHRMLKKGLTPSVALQQTQIEMWRARRNPNKWAAFTFYGEWEK